MSRPVSAAELVETTMMGEIFLVPEACVDCRVLTSKRAAEARGMIVRDNEYFPPNKEHEVISELEERSVHAIAGLCRFVKYEQDCWRREEE